MPRKKNKRSEKNGSLPEEERLHPELTDEERDEFCRWAEREGENYSLAKAIAVNVSKTVLGLPRTEKATPLVMELADEIWLPGLLDAWRDFKPDAGARFKTFLYIVLKRKAGKVRRRFFSRMPPKVRLNIVTVRHVGIHYGVSDYSTDENGSAIPWYTRYVFDFQNCDFSFLPCGLKLPGKIEVTSDDLLEAEQPYFNLSDLKREQEYREFYGCLGYISYEEFVEHGRDHLPNSFRKLTDKALKKKLANLDVRIVEMLIDDEKPACQIEIQQKLGISKEFYKVRIGAILHRLQIPSESIKRRFEETKRREMRLRNSETITGIAMEKILIFSPPQPVEICFDGERRLEWNAQERLFTEDEESFPWHDESGEPKDFVGTPSEPVKEKSELASLYSPDDTGHWELVDDSWFE